MPKRETTEQMLSRMGVEREAGEAAKRGLTVVEHRAAQHTCKHEWINKGLYDECSKCDAGRA